jgi:hypothetical protein
LDKLRKTTNTTSGIEMCPSFLSLDYTDPELLYYPAHCPHAYDNSLWERVSLDLMSCDLSLPMMGSIEGHCLVAKEPQILKSINRNFYEFPCVLPVAITSNANLVPNLLNSIESSTRYPNQTPTISNKLDNGEQAGKTSFFDNIERGEAWSFCNAQPAFGGMSKKRINLVPVKNTHKKKKTPFDGMVLKLSSL